MRRVLLATLCLAACHSTLDGTNTNPDATGLTVHEWGTFTSMSDSTGTPLVGMHHEEEPLPDFVYRRSREYVRKWKGMEALPVGVNQKLETPVVYFYSDKAQDIDLKVDFPKGVISEWFPNAMAFAPALAENETSLVPKDGSMHWQGSLVPGMATTTFPSVASTDIWAPSRQVASAPLRIQTETGTEDEQFIFYRGIGEFRLPFDITSNDNGTINVANSSNDDSPAVFLLRVHEGGGAIVPLGKLGKKSSLGNIQLPFEGKEHDLDQYVLDAKAQIATALVASGLNTDEAQAMVETWSRSYFQSFGLRILYIVPRQWTDDLLPMTVSPKPDTLVRTLVGRVEVLTKSDEQTLVAQVKAAAANAQDYDALLATLGRFAEPKLRRAQQLVTDAATQTYLDGAITAVNAVSTSEP